MESANPTRPKSERQAPFTMFMHHSVCQCQARIFALFVFEVSMSSPLLPIQQIADTLSLTPDRYETIGAYGAKLKLDLLADPARRSNARRPNARSPA